MAWGTKRTERDFLGMVADIVSASEPGLTEPGDEEPGDEEFLEASPVGRGESIGPPPADVWLQDLDYLVSIHSNRTVKRAAKLRCRIQVDAIEPNGEIQGSCVSPGEVVQVRVELGYSDGPIRLGCSCSDSNQERQCMHTLRFIKYLIVLITESGSNVLPGATPSPVQPPAADRKLLSDLDSFLANRSYYQEEPEDSSETDIPETRLVWKVSTEEELSLTVVSQRRKKRGSGWTKGSKVTFEKLKTSPELVRSSRDEKAVAAIAPDASYSYGFYRPLYKMDYLTALEALAGHDLVMLDEEFAEVKRSPFAIGVTEDGEFVRLRLQFDGCRDRSWRVFLVDGGLIASTMMTPESSGRPMIVGCRYDDGELALAKALLDRDIRWPRKRLPLLRERLDKMAKYTSLQLPESMAGPVVEDEAPIVALLRSRQSGHLECGLRVRDAMGRLNLPAGGVLLYADENDGEPLQRQRDATSERIRARKAAESLGLARARALSDWDWQWVDFEAAIRFLERIEADATDQGIELVWDPRSVEPIRVLGAVTSNNVQVSVSRKRDWFGLEGQCRIGEQEFQLADLLTAVGSEPLKGYLEVQPGQWARISTELREQLQRLRDVAHKRRQSLEVSPTAAPVFQELLEAQIDLEAPRAWQECLDRLDRAKALDPVPPATFRGTLRDYQVEGYRWLRRLAEWGVGGCLADDMGLGKTIQALAVLLDRMNSGPALVIAPTSVGFNWVREAARFAPTLRVHSYRDTDRAAFLETLSPGDLVICSYGLALRDAEALAQVEWGTLILDEAQFIKNSRSKTSQAIRNIPADWTVALSGTPMENHLGELWSLFRNVSPGLFGSWDQFRDRFASPIERNNDLERREALSNLIRPFVLRRTKDEVLQELPPRTEMNLYVDLSQEERSRYDSMRLAALGELDEIVGLPEIKDQRFRVLALLTRLRQLACHPGLVDKTWEGRSAKLETLIETLSELKEEGHRTLVFSQFTQYLALMQRALDQHGITYQYLDGSTTPKARQERVDRFQAGESDAFLISLKAGGTGLNLTAADYVIHMDPWWNPAVESQATDRAHRIGQTEAVMVYRVVARGTIEEQILDLHREKRDLVDGVMQGTQAAGDFSTGDLIEMIRNSYADA